MKTLVRLLAPLPALILLSPAGAADSPYRNVDQLWAGFDPRALALDAKVLKETSGNGIVLRTVEYTSEVSSGFAVRIVSYYAFPEGGRHLPAVMHLHGGGQNATRGYVEHWAKRGYAALSIDWGGKPLENDPANGRTDWGPLPYNQNGKDAGNIYHLSPDARHNSWYHWTIAARRGLTFLERQPEVDRSRIGVFGVSMGGTLTWILAGVDDRLRCAAPVVGTALFDQPLPNIPGSGYERALRASPLWRKTIDPYAYAGRIRCPLFFLSAANDFHARIDLVDLTLEEIPGRRHWQSFTPHFSHHIDAPEALALDLWMDRWLKDGPVWPASPVATLRLDTADHVPRAAIRPDRASAVENVTFYSSTGLSPQSRFWRTIPSVSDGETWSARLPLTAIEDRGLLVYGNVAYKSGLILSTRLATATAGQLRQAQVALTDPPSPVIDDFRRGAADWWVPEASPNVLLADTAFFRPVEGPAGMAALAWIGRPTDRWRFFTRKVGDPKWRGAAGAGLAFAIRSAQPNTVVAMVAENYESLPRPPRVYAATARLEGGNWETVRLALSDFHDLQGGSQLANWAAVDLLGITGHYNFSGTHMGLKSQVLGMPWQGPAPAIANVRWSKNE